MPFNKIQFSPLEIITPQRSYHLPPMYAGRPEGKCDKHKTVMLNVGAVELSRTSEKKMNSSLSFGQAVLTFFLPGATSCSSLWMILLVDVLPGPLRQVSFSCYMYLPSKKIYKCLPWTTAQDFFWALVWSKAPTWSWLIWQNMKSFTLISILIISLDQNQCFLLISFRFSNAFHSRTNQGDISSRWFWQWRYCIAWWGLYLRLKPEITFDNIEKKLISWWIITIIIVINHQKSKCFTIAGRITRVAGSKGLNFLVVVLC